MTSLPTIRACKLGQYRRPDGCAPDRVDQRDIGVDKDDWGFIAMRLKDDGEGIAKFIVLEHKDD